MTKKLYYQNPYLTEFQAKILDIKEKDNFFHLLLDQTAFYPGGGGQPADKGTINDIEVKEIYTEKDKIFHVITKMPDTNLIKGVINKKFRLEMMQQHLGQHLLSAVLYKNFSARTVGFHLSENNLTIDIDKVLNPAQIEKTEKIANDIIYSNLDVKKIYPGEEELKNMPLRKKPSVSDNIRIIAVGNYDFSPCGGTHPETTAEVGIIKINEFENYKNGLRIHFSCGIRALKNYAKKEKILQKTVEILSVPEEQITKRVNKLLTENKNLQKEKKFIKNRLLKFLAEKLLSESEDYAGIKFISKIFSDQKIITQNELSYLASELTKNKDVVFISSLNINGICRFIFSRSKNINSLNMQQILNQALEITGGGGGGSSLTAQGGGGDASKVKTAFAEVKNSILEKIS